MLTPLRVTFMIRPKVREADDDDDDNEEEETVGRK